MLPREQRENLFAEFKQTSKNTIGYEGTFKELKEEIKFKEHVKSMSDRGWGEAEQAYLESLLQLHNDFLSFAPARPCLEQIARRLTYVSPSQIADKANDQLRNDLLGAFDIVPGDILHHLEDVEMGDMHGVDDIAKTFVHVIGKLRELSNPIGHTTERSFNSPVLDIIKKLQESVKASMNTQPVAEFARWKDNNKLVGYEDVSGDDLTCELKLVKGNNMEEIAMVARHALAQVLCYEMKSDWNKGTSIKFITVTVAEDMVYFELGMIESRSEPRPRISVAHFIEYPSGGFSTNFLKALQSLLSYRC